MKRLLGLLKPGKFPAAVILLCGNQALERLQLIFGALDQRIGRKDE
jgi:hypothetical protein